MRYFLVLLAIGFFNCALAQPTPNEAYGQEIIYGHKDGLALTMAKIPAKGKDKHKAIISLVSGNWISTYGMLQRYAEGSAIYANNGFTVFMVMHGSQPRYSIADEVEDVRRAVRFIRYNARQYGIDSLHIGITGSSSGGHLSLLAALMDDEINTKAKDEVDRVSSRLQAAAVFFPPTDFLNWGAPNSGIINPSLVRFGVAAAFDFKKLSSTTGMYEHLTDTAEIAAMAKKLSPLYLVSSDDPPVLITHGDADAVVPLQQSLSIIEKLKAAGVKNEFILHEGGGHGWNNSEVEKQKFVEWFDKWLK